MQRTWNILILGMSLSALIGGCGRTVVSDVNAFKKLIFKPERGLVKEKQVGSILYKLNFMPASYLAYNSCLQSGATAPAVKDSLLAGYANSLTFLLNIGPAKGQDFDITQLGVANYGEFAEQLEQLAFKAADWIALEVNGQVYKPSLVRMENINALEKSRNFMVVFENPTVAGKDLTQFDWTFVYADELFNTGVNKFLFSKEAIQKIPEFKF